MSEENMSTATPIKAADLFRAMADRIDKNPDEFQGAYLCVGPDAVVISNSFFGATSNIPVFWGTAKNHIGLEADDAARKADQNSQTANAYGRSR